MIPWWKWCCWSAAWWWVGQRLVCPCCLDSALCCLWLPTSFCLVRHFFLVGPSMWLGRRWHPWSYCMVPGCNRWRWLCLCQCFVLACPVLVSRACSHTSVPILPLFWVLPSSGNILVVLHCPLLPSWPFCRAMSWGICIVIAGTVRFCTLGWLFQCMTTLPLALCFVIWRYFSWGWDYCLHLGRCCWAWSWKTACWPTVTVIENMLRGVCSTHCGTGGLMPICTLQHSASGSLVTLGCEIFTLGFCSATLGSGVARHASVWACIQFCCSFAFADDAFAKTIFVNSLLTLCSASAVLDSGAMFPWRALDSCCAAWMTIVSGETLGFVMYWCLKNTVLLILVTLVFTI